MALSFNGNNFLQEDWSLRLETVSLTTAPCDFRTISPKGIVRLWSSSKAVANIQYLPLRQTLPALLEPDSIF